MSDRINWLLVRIDARFFRDSLTAIAAVFLCHVSSLAQAKDSAFTGSSWILQTFRSSSDEGGTKRPLDPSAFVMTLSGDGSVHMKLGCNRATGTWQAEPGADASSGRFTFGPLAGTRALCPPPRLDELVTRQSSYVRSFVLVDDVLYLNLMADGGTFSWKRVGKSGNAAEAQVYRSPEDGGPRNWTVVAGTSGLNLRDGASMKASIVSSYRTGTILDNLGCERAGSRTWCDVQALGGGPRGYVAAEFIEPAISPDGSVATGVDDSALRAGQGKFDATGSIPCAAFPGQPTVPCKLGVARSGGGYASVVVTKPSGRERVIYFRMGRAIGASMTQADRWEGFSVSRDGDLNLIRIGNERYEIPDAVIFGG